MFCVRGDDSTQALPPDPALPDRVPLNPTPPHTNSTQPNPSYRTPFLKPTPFSSPSLSKPNPFSSRHTPGTRELKEMVLEYREMHARLVGNAI